MRFRHVIASMLVFLVSVSTASAKDEGFYLGASVGLASTEAQYSNPDFGAFDLDDNDFAFKLFGGYQFSPLLAVEGGYRDLGSTSEGIVGIDLQGFDLFAVAGVPLGPLRVFGKAGAIYWDSDGRVGRLDSFSDDGFDWGLGAGLEMEIGSIAVRGEVEYFDVLDGSLMVSGGVTLTF